MADPQKTAAATPAATGRTPEEVIQMFGALGLPVCDDGDAIQNKVDAQTARYQRDKNSPNRDLAHVANIWFKNAADLKQRHIPARFKIEPTEGINRRGVARRAETAYADFLASELLDLGNALYGDEVVGKNVKQPHDDLYARAAQRSRDGRTCRGK